MTKLSRSKIKKKLSVLTKNYIKDLDNYTCQYCGKQVEGSNAHGSHILNVASHAHMEFDPCNLKTLSYHSHLNFWHKDIIAAGEWFTNKYPERWAYLQDRDKLRIKITTPELDEMLKTFPVSWQEYYSDSLEVREL